eukprot:m.188402 g.188402  ORF g.188402 m.188402 type:complete len:82 (-) comp15081_c1_seq6:1685-1930(-)
MKHTPIVDVRELATQKEEGGVEETALGVFTSQFDEHSPKSNDHPKHAAGTPGCSWVGRAARPISLAPLTHQLETRTTKSKV